MNDLDRARKQEIDLNNISDEISNSFIEEFNLLDSRTLALLSTYSLSYITAETYHANKMSYPQYKAVQQTKAQQTK